MAKRLLVTGAGGFIGGFIIEEALRRGYEVTAAVRESTSRRFLTDERILFLILDYEDEQSMLQSISAEVAKSGRWDYVVHNLGATKAANFAAFETTNCEYLKRVVRCLKAADAVPECLLMMSSMGVLGVGDERGGSPFTDKSVPHPVTKYGLSKLLGENFLRSQTDVPYVILRPTGVYGPHERDYFLMIKSISRGFDFSVGFREQRLTFIYVEDLARAVIDALERAPRGNAYLISEDRDYSQRDFRRIVKAELGRRFVVPVKAPLWLVKMVCWASEQIALATLKLSTLNRDKYKILRQRNWRCDVTGAERDFGFKARVSLAEGLHRAIEWYRGAGWL